MQLCTIVFRNSFQSYNPMINDLEKGIDYFYCLLDYRVMDPNNMKIFLIS